MKTDKWLLNPGPYNRPQSRQVYWEAAKAAAFLLALLIAVLVVLGAAGVAVWYVVNSL